MARKRANGEGTIRKRWINRKDGTTYKRYFARITISWDGRHKKSKDGPLRKTQEEAKDDLTQLQQQLAKGLLNAQSSQRFKEYADAWLEQAQRTCKFRTWQTYESDMRNHVLPHLGHKRLDKICKIDVQNMVNAIHQQAVDADRSGAAVARKARAVLRKALQDAVDLDILPTNPCLGVKVPPELVDTVELWTPEETVHFMEVAKDFRIYPLIYTAITTGLREGELLGLRWRDLETWLDVETGELIGQLYIRKTLVYVAKKDQAVARRNPMIEHLNGNLFLDDPKTKKSKSYVTIPADTVEELLIHHFKQQQEVRNFHRWTDFGLIFPAKFGTPMSPKSLYDSYKRVIDRAQVPDIKFHDLRDTHATYLLVSGEDLGTVSDRLRHSTKSTTLNRYIQVLNRRRRKAARKLTELLHERD